MFNDLERFVTAHRPYGASIATVGEPTESGYDLEIICTCGVVFQRWITTQMADENLLRSGLMAFQN